ncbi:MAG TPA: PilN domain-containing protein [Noviherbaspirillum sp.]|uniref:PilN domain-containing protein n=1 Tax=Noviherbaspirillum sp. TaxID=1926288 RepID=UPI002B464616|nr:PilN domain-containing protein [Noviherbaspirillum sp.]HJV85656.1 PilN domain-containing protein [Noviherbaspirillum sp.]
MSQQINLFNPIFLKQKKYFSAVTMIQALGMILGGCLLVGAYAYYQVKAQEREAALTTSQLALVQAQLAKVNASYGPAQKSKALEEELHRTETEVKSMQQVFAILQKGEFGNTKGYAEYLRAFARQIVNGLWLTGFSIEGAGSEIAIRGRALQPGLVPAYIGRLRNEAVLQGKSFAALDMRLPPSEPGDKEKVAAASATAKPHQPAYIEFSLQSSGAMKDGRAGTPGAANQ